MTNIRKFSQWPRSLFPISQFLLFPILIAVISCDNAGQKDSRAANYKNAREYNNYIIDRHSRLMKEQMKFGEFARTNLDSATFQLEVISKQAEDVLTDIKGMPPFKKDSALRDAAIQSFIFYTRIFNEDYPKLIALARKERDSADVFARPQIDEIVTKVIGEEKKYDSSFQVAQKAFADKNKLDINN